MAGREISGAGAELGRESAWDAAARSAVLPSKRLSLQQRMADHTQESLYAKVEDP
jgi:hypothetical protein